MGLSGSKEQTAIGDGPEIYTKKEKALIAEWVSACHDKDKEKFQKLLDEGKLEITPDDITPLHTCAGNPEFLEQLMNKGIPINRRVKHNMKTPLHYAVEYGNLSCINILLNNGADPTIKDEEGNTAYRTARERNHYPAIYSIRYHMLKNKWEEKLDINNPKQVCRNEMRKLREIMNSKDNNLIKQYETQYLKCISGAFCYGESERFRKKVEECQIQPEDKREECAKEFFEFYQGCLARHQ